MVDSVADDGFLERVISIGIVSSSFNKVITDRLLSGALRELQRHDHNRLDVVWVDGAFEIPAVLKAMAITERYDALLALGCIIRGETSHFDHLAQACASGIMNVSVETSVPIGFGVLTCDTLTQARARSEPGGDNKGVDAAKAVVNSIHTISHIRSII